MAKESLVKCPVCEEKFELEPDLEVGDTTSCPGCYAELKLVRLHPVQVEEVMFSADDFDEEEDGDGYTKDN